MGNENKLKIYLDINKSSSWQLLAVLDDYEIFVREVTVIETVRPLYNVRKAREGELKCDVGGGYYNLDYILKVNGIFINNNKTSLDFIYT